MSIQKHPDYKKELERLEYTKEIIDAILNTTGQNKDTYKGNIKDAFVNLDWVDSSLSYINILTNTKFLEMSERNYEHLIRIEKKPYFARIDFQLNDQKKTDTFYIGKTSLFRKDTNEPIIVDWRSPVANVYYDGRLGEVSYEAEGNTYNGYLSLKRQFQIEDGQLQDIRDIDVTTRDELLQESLSTNADNRLTDIVTTIQGEQNRIIRADLNRPLIVQGVAGSGKTTIALHRIAYFIYSYAEQFSSDQMMILAPNRLFLDYISEVLPELGVDQVNQTTFTDFVRDCIGKKYRLMNDQKLLMFIQGNKEKENSEEQLRWVSEVKGSMFFKTMIDQYLKELEESFVPDENFMLDRFILYHSEKIERLFLEEYSYLPYFKRVDKIQSVLKNQLKLKKKQVVEKLEIFYDDKIESALYDIKNKEKRRKKVTALSNKKDQRLEEVQRLSRNALKQFMTKFLQKKELFVFYKELLSDTNRLYRYGKGEISEEQCEVLSNTSLSYLNNKKIELEDMAALLYLQHKIFGLKLDLSIKNIVIDEAQDYSMFQFYVLKEVLNTSLFTILGDLTQGIHSYRGIKNWEEVIETLFPKGNYLTLQKSYRTTIEIMELANQVIVQNMNPIVPLAEPVVRHGDKPKFISLENGNVVKSLTKLLHQIKNDGLKTIAIIAKTKEDCKKIKKQLDQVDSDFTVKILGENEEIRNVDIVIVPSYLSKGLEFDAVILVNIDENYRKEELDIKLLYVAMTRPLHRLYFIGPSLSSFLLENIKEVYLTLATDTEGGT
jgi:DNA helicase-2/ATP-dependent DNA helicase PcrA